MTNVTFAIPEPSLTFFPETISPSMMGDIFQCEMYFFRRHCQRYTIKAENPHLLAGRFFAKACEIVRTSYYFDKKSEDESIALGNEYLENCPETGSDTKNITKLIFCLEAYFKKFPLKDVLMPSKLVDGGFAIEYDFIFDLGIPHPDFPEINIKFKGRLDAIYDRHYLGQKIKSFIVDEKTTERITRIKGTNLPDIVKEAEKYKLSNQFIAYSWAADQIGKKVDGVLIRRIPILAQHEDAYELEFKITQFQKDMWSMAMYNKIWELRDKYLNWKNDPSIPSQAFFTPEYDTGCSYFNRTCEYAVGCIEKEGEDILKSTFPQLIWNHELKQEMELQEYLDYMNEKGTIK